MTSLVQSSLLLATESGAARRPRAAAAWLLAKPLYLHDKSSFCGAARSGALAIIIFKREEKGGPDWLAVAS